jgi:hypothetical protein
MTEDVKMSMSKVILTTVAIKENIYLHQLKKNINLLHIIF